MIQKIKHELKVMLEIIWANPRAFVVVVVVCLFVFKGMKDFVFLVTQYLISFLNQTPIVLWLDRIPR